jgi:hypothetical protein
MNGKAWCQVGRDALRLGPGIALGIGLLTLFMNSVEALAALMRLRDVRDGSTRGISEWFEEPIWTLSRRGFTVSAFGLFPAAGFLRSGGAEGIWPGWVFMLTITRATFS